MDLPSIDITFPSVFFKPQIRKVEGKQKVAKDSGESAKKKVDEKKTKGKASYA